MDYYAHAPHTVATLERLARERPEVLACMHGSAWRGDGAALLRALARIAPPEIEILPYRGIGDLPLFNPDIEYPNPAAVADLREGVEEAAETIDRGLANALLNCWIAYK